MKNARMNIMRSLKIGLSLIILLLITVFFIREFQKSWADIRLYGTNLNSAIIVLSIVALSGTYLCFSSGIFITLKTLSNENALTFRTSIAIVNTAGLAKYVPGKIWSYALLMHWFARIGIPASVAAYAFLLNTVISLITSLIIGIGFAALSSDTVSAVSAVMILTVLTVDVCFICYSSPVINWFFSLYNRLFKRTVPYLELSKSLLVRLHGINILAAFFFGFGAYLLCLGMGYTIELPRILSVMSAMLISDVVGFLVFILPGGLGAKEGTMYLLLRGNVPPSLSLILPIAARISVMTVDIFLGVVGFAILNRELFPAGKGKCCE